MDELYEAIENTIADSGYPEKVNGFSIYEELCDEIEGKENGTYLLVKNKGEDVVFSYELTVMEDSFDLSWLHIADHGTQYHINFDREQELPERTYL